MGKTCTPCSTDHQNIQSNSSESKSKSKSDEEYKFYDLSYNKDRNENENESRKRQIIVATHSSKGFIWNEDVFVSRYHSSFLIESKSNYIESIQNQYNRNDFSFSLSSSSSSSSSASSRTPPNCIRTRLSLSSSSSNSGQDLIDYVPIHEIHLSEIEDILPKVS